jgi:hypothetical protein
MKILKSRRIGPQEPFKTLLAGDRKGVLAQGE